MSITIIPLADNIVIERAAPDRYIGLIALPSVKYDDKTVSGVVVAVGPKVVDVKVLDVVAFPKFANKEFVVGDRKVLMLREAEIFAVIG